MPRSGKSSPSARTTSPLTTAIHKCDLKALKKLLATGTIDVNAPLGDAHGVTPFELAIYQRGATPLALALLDAGAEVDLDDVNLIWAVQTGRPDVVRTLIAAGADVNMHAIMGTPIEVAAHEGQAEMIRDLIAAGADINAGSILHSPLEAALDRDQTEAALVLIKAGAKLNRERSIRQLLHETIGKKNHAVMTALIEAGADVNERERGGTEQTPLIRAVQVGTAEMVRELIAAGADVHARDTQGMTALDRARQMKRTKIVAVLQEAVARQLRRVDPNEELLFAAERGDVNHVRLMIAAGASLETRDKRARTGGFTPLMLAAAAGHVDVVNTLLKAGADVVGRDSPPTPNYQPQKFVADESGDDMIPATGWLFARTALHCAAASGHAPVVRILLDAGADASDADRLKVTPLHLAAEAGSLDTVDELLRSGANVNAVNDSKETPLFVAAVGNHAAVLGRLLENKPKLEGKNKRGQTALYAAAAQAYPAAVKLLSDAGADVDAVDRDQNTVLHAVLHAEEMVEVDEHGFRYTKSVKPGDRVLEIVRTLLAAGADPRVKDSTGRTPLNWASLFAPKAGPLADLVGVLKEGERSARQHPARPVVKPKPVPAAREAKPAPKSKLKKTGVHLEEPDFAARAKRKAYQQAVTDLEALCGTPRQPTGDRAGAFRFHAHSKKNFDLKKVNADFAARGFCVFSISASEANPIVILPTADRYQAIAFMGTNGNNFGLGSADIVRWLKDLQKTHPFVLTGIGMDFLDGYFTRKVAKPAELARRIYEFCPDIVSQGVGDLPALTAALRRSRRLFFWWD